MENKDFLKQTLTGLKQIIPYRWRVQSFSKHKAQAAVVAYIDARDCMELLDEHCHYGWDRRHIQVENKIYCEVGIRMPDNSIIWRSDCGIESNTEGEKGQASDSFKRACVNFGIGRFLYDLPLEYVTADAIKGDKDEDKNGVKYKRFPNPVDEQGKTIRNMSDFINRRSNMTPPSLPKEEPKKKPVLSPGSEKWKDAISFLKGTGTMQRVHLAYELSKEHEELLKEAIL